MQDLLGTSRLHRNPKAFPIQPVLPQLFCSAIEHGARQKCKGRPNGRPFVFQLDGSHGPSESYGHEWRTPSKPK